MKIRTRLAALSVAAAVAAGGAATLAGGAGAAVVRDTGPALEAARARCNVEIDQRVFALAMFQYDVSQRRHLTQEQKDDFIASTQQVIDNLLNVNRPAVNAATNRDELSLACMAIFYDNRVFAVVLPQYQILSWTSVQQNAIDLLTAKSAELAAQGYDTSEADALLAAAQVSTDNAEEIASEQSPAAFNENPDAVRAAFEEARNQAVLSYWTIVAAWATLAELDG